MKISIIVPCYNEEAALPIFYKEIKKVLMGLTSTYELIFVNDGSKDHTLPLLRQLAEEDKNVTYYSFSRNFGKEAAMYAGFCNAHGDYVAVMDADMQDPPGLLPKMIEILESGDYDSVATRRVNRQGEPPIQLFSLGIIGQYLARTYTEVKHRPHYIISESNHPDFDSVK